MSDGHFPFDSLSLSLNPNVNSSVANVQHVTKKSSDELLSKFAQVDDEDDGFESKNEHPTWVSAGRRKGRRTSRREESDACRSPSHYSTGAATLVERRSLLAPVASKSALLRELGIAAIVRSRLRARDIKNKSVLVAIQKTWCKTMEGASNVLLEKHYGRHRRLINDVI